MRATSSELTQSLSLRAMPTCSTIADQTSPFDGSDGVSDSPRMPMTVRTTSPIGARCRPRRITVGVPWPGMYAPDVSSTWVRSTLGKNDSISFFPNSRFMNEFAVINPHVSGPVDSGGGGAGVRQREPEEPLGKGHGERVLPVTRPVPLPV